MAKPKNKVTAFKSGRGVLLLVTIATIINFLILLLDTDLYLAFSYVLVTLVYALLGKIMFFITSVLLIGISFLCYFLSKNNKTWLIAASTLYAADCIALLIVIILNIANGEVPPPVLFVSLILHGFMMYMLIDGCRCADEAIEMINSPSGNYNQNISNINYSNQQPYMNSQPMQNNQQTFVNNPINEKPFKTFFGEIKITNLPGKSTTLYTRGRLEFYENTVVVLMVPQALNSVADLTVGMGAVGGLVRGITLADAEKEVLRFGYNEIDCHNKSLGGKYIALYNGARVYYTQMSSKKIQEILNRYGIRQTKNR